MCHFHLYKVIFSHYIFTFTRVWLRVLLQHCSNVITPHTEQLTVKHLFTLYLLYLRYFTDYMLHLESFQGPALKFTEVSQGLVKATSRRLSANHRAARQCQPIIIQFNVFCWSSSPHKHQQEVTWSHTGNNQQTVEMHKGFTIKAFHVL